jgi:nucleoside-diphosphate-sugar epimerase
MKKVYIIGASGFLGTKLCEEFSTDHQVYTAPGYMALDNYNIWQKQICEELTSIRPNIVLIPAANQSTHDDLEAIEQLINSNCKLPISVASTLLANNLDTQLVIFGTSWQRTDSNNYRPFNLYAASKQAGDDLLHHYALRGLKVSSIMLFDTYGNSDNRKKLLNLLINAAHTGDELELTPGDQEIDLVDIEDVCRGVRQCLIELADWEASKGIMARGLGTGQPQTVKELVGKISATLNRDLKILYGKRPYRDREPMTVYKQYTKPKNWQPKEFAFGLQEALNND